MLPDACTRYSRGIESQQDLPIGDVNPSVVLKADLTKRSDMLEAQPLMKSDTRFVREGSATDGNVYTPVSQGTEKLSVETSPDTSPFVPVVEVDSRFDGVAICAPYLPFVRIRVPNY